MASLPNNQADAEPNSARPRERPTFYRLVHSSGELSFDEPEKACAAMRLRPGAKVFVKNSGSPM